MRPNKSSMVTTAQVNFDGQYNDSPVVPQPKLSLQQRMMHQTAEHVVPAVPETLPKKGMDPYGPPTNTTNTTSNYLLPKPQLPSSQPASGNCDISPSYMQQPSSNPRQMPRQQPRPAPMDEQQPTSFSPSSMFSKPAPSSSAVFGGGAQLSHVGAIPKASNDIMTRGVEADGGYNFRRIMDDHFEHYKRPASREQSVDKGHMPTVLSEARNPTLNRQSRQSSRTRTPMRNISLSKTDLNADAAAAKTEGLVVEEAKTNGGPPNLFGGQENIKYRGPSQTIDNIGTIPKRTESMYFKPFEADDSSSAKVRNDYTLIV